MLFLLDIVKFIYLLQVYVQADACPKQVDSEIQSCIEESGMYNLDQTVGSTFTGDSEKSNFCSTGIRSAVTCIENVSNKCALYTEQRKMISLIVDVEKMETDFNYFCDNLHVFSANRSCFSGFYKIANCIETSTSQKGKTVSQNRTAKQLMDNLCGLFDVINTCYLVSFPLTCSMTSKLFIRLFNGARYPYCDLSEVDKQMKLSALMAHTSNSSMFPISINTIIMCTCIVLSITLMYKK